MMVWQGSYQGRCARQRSRGATIKGFVTEKISNAFFCFIRGKLWEGSFYISISRESMRQFIAQCTQGGRIYIIKLDLMVEKGE
jgi:hypothetical protein